MKLEYWLFDVVSDNGVLNVVVNSTHNRIQHKKLIVDVEDIVHEYIGRVLTDELISEMSARINDLVSKYGVSKNGAIPKI